MAGHLAKVIWKVGFISGVIKRPNVVFDTFRSWNIEGEALNIFYYS